MIDTGARVRTREKKIPWRENASPSCSFTGMAIEQSQILAEKRRLREQCGVGGRLLAIRMLRFKPEVL
jgi:hypothetical protein